MSRNGSSISHVQIFATAFPFVNAQITAFFSLAIIFVFPFLYLSFVNKIWFACFMNFLTVLCFLGLHEVGEWFTAYWKTLRHGSCLITFLILLARELENPFVNVPNDLPLCTFQVRKCVQKISRRVAQRLGLEAVHWAVALTDRYPRPTTQL